MHYPTMEEKIPFTQDAVDPERGLSTPRRISWIWRVGTIALIIAGTTFMLLGVFGALYLWKVTDKNVYNVRYSVSINGKTEEGSMEIDSENNLERFKIGSGDEEAVEIHDFQIGITGIRFSGGEKCYIKSQIKAKLPEVETVNKDSLMIELEDEVMPARFDDKSVIWVAAKEPLQDSSFLTSRILNLCGHLPIFWLRPTYPYDSRAGGRERRDVERTKRQYDNEVFEAEALDTPASAQNVTSGTGEEEGREGSASAFNPENPYHQRSGGGEAGEGEAGPMTFDPMLDHNGICCAECQRSYTHCERICEPLGGYWPWPYNYHGCRVACRVILPCRWWVARIMGLV
ncbi:leukocyte cell-derived chemotaxin 1 [Engraulis encrasicolus]|uniref:leukocyte cell-derived chemotaxin 1 n=1 Tax=Engraulis encrasicolus TaxID=184585 RepID=UPI002FCFCDF9